MGLRFFLLIIGKMLFGLRCPFLTLSCCIQTWSGECCEMLQHVGQHAASQWVVLSGPSAALEQRRSAKTPSMASAVADAFVLRFKRAKGGIAAHLLSSCSGAAHLLQGALHRPFTHICNNACRSSCRWFKRSAGSQGKEMKTGMRLRHKVYKSFL